mgnify:CR=1 FL=1
MTKTTNVNAGDLNYDKYANEIYDDDIRRSIPGHDNLHKEIINTVREYSKHHEVMKILELGIGTGLTSEKILELIPTASLTAVDFSEQMMSGAKKRLSKFKVDYLLGDYSEMELILILIWSFLLLAFITKKTRGRNYCSEKSLILSKLGAYSSLAIS